MLISTICSLNADWNYEFVAETNANISQIHIDENFIYALSTDKIHRYSNQTKKWELIDIPISNGSRIKDIYGYSDKLILSSLFNGTFISYDNGDSWSEFPFDEELSKIYKFAENEEYIFAYTFNILLRCEKETFIWDYVLGGAEFEINDISVSGNNVALPYYDPLEKKSGVLVSTNNGEKWENRYEGRITNLTMKGDTIAAFVNNEIQLSFNAGKSWVSNELDRSGQIFLKDESIEVYTYNSELKRFNYKMDSIEIIDMKSIFGIFKVSTLEAKYDNGKYYFPTYYGLFIYDEKSRSSIDNVPQVNAELFRTAAIKEDSLFLLGYDKKVYKKYKDSDIWENYEPSLSKLDMYFDNLMIMDGELHFIDYLESEKKIRIGHRNKNGKWEVSLVNIFNFKKIDKLRGQFYFTDAINLYVSDDFIEIDTLSPPLSKDGEKFESIINLIAFENTIFVSTSFGVYELDINTKGWTEILTDNGESLEKSKTLVTDGERLFTYNLSLENDAVLYEYKKSSKELVNIFKHRIYNTSNVYSNLFWRDENIFWRNRDSLLMTNDNGKTIQYINKELQPGSLLTPILYGNYIYATTYNGVFKRSISDFGLSNVYQEDTHNKRIITYPQPAKDVVIIELPSTVSNQVDIENIQIYDYQGRNIISNGKLKFQLNSNSHNIVWDCSGLKKGVYIINFELENVTHSFKVLIE